MSFVLAANLSDLQPKWWKVICGSGGGVLRTLCTVYVELSFCHCLLDNCRSSEFSNLYQYAMPII